MITFESVCEKLGYDFTKDKPSKEERAKMTEDDGQNSPYRVLSAEESQFILDYYAKMREKNNEL